MENDQKNKVAFASRAIPKTEIGITGFLLLFKFISSKIDNGNKAVGMLMKATSFGQRS
jgi:hypothetical protein